MGCQVVTLPPFVRASCRRAFAMLPHSFMEHRRRAPVPGDLVAAIDALAPARARGVTVGAALGYHRAGTEEGMFVMHALAGLVGGLVVLGVTPSNPAPAADDGALRADLEEVSRRSIFFGHQSVGGNLLDGVTALAARGGVPLRIVASDGARGLSPGTFAHALVGANGHPASKLRGFEQALAGADVDLALVKLCYTDVEAGTDARALFARYEETLAALRARHPRTTFVHVTVPLTTVQGGVKGMVKRLMGRAPAGVVENARREEFNELLRRAVGGKEPLFDLARVESTAPDGSRSTYDLGGRPVPALVPEYTDDGGHLAGDGRARAARQLLAVLATASRRGAFPAR